MPFVVGIRIQNAYILRNSPADEEEKKGISPEKFEEKAKEIYRKYLPPEYFKGEWQDV